MGFGDIINGETKVNKNAKDKRMSYRQSKQDIDPSRLWSAISFGSSTGVLAGGGIYFVKARR
jgi:hypothetical protein